MVWIWLGIVIFLIFIEVITVGLTTVWFVISGFVSLILSLFIDSIVLGVLLLITTRPYLVKKLHVKESKTNLDRVIGMRGIVTEDITTLNPGEVKVDGKRWTAISDTDISNKYKNINFIPIIFRTSNTVCVNLQLRIKELPYNFV